MKVGEICTRETVIVRRHDSLLVAGRLMRDYHVGSLVVVDEDSMMQPIPVGIVTDRDILMQVLAEDVPLEKIGVEDIMSAKPVTAKETDDLSDALLTLRQHGIRRLPVTDAKGCLTGILSFDDILESLAEEMSDLASVSSREKGREAEKRR